MNTQKLKNSGNKTFTWIWKHKKTISAIVIIGAAIGSQVLPGEYGDMADKVKDKAPEVIKKIEHEGGQRTNENNEIIFFK